MRLSVMRADGSGQRPVGDASMWTVGGIGIPPAWSPDGKRIFYVDGDRGLSVIDVDGNNRRRLMPRGFKVFSFAVFPDGERVAVAAGHGGHTNLYVVDGKQRRLLPDGGQLYDFALSPDGSRIAVDAPRAGTRSVYVVNSDGSNLKRLAEGGAPSWYAGDRIVYARTVGTRAQLYLMDTDGGSQRSLGTDVSADLGAAVSPTVR